MHVGKDMLQKHNSVEVNAARATGQGTTLVLSSWVAFPGRGGWVHCILRIFPISKVQSSEIEHTLHIYAFLSTLKHQLAFGF